MSEKIEIIDLEEPIGNFIFEQKDIKGTYTDNGAYYHYADVCTLLNRLKDKLTNGNK